MGQKSDIPPPAGAPANSTGPRLLAGEAGRVTQKMTRRSTAPTSQTCPSTRSWCERSRAPLPGRGGQTTQREICCGYFQDYGYCCYKACTSC